MTDEDLRALMKGAAAVSQISQMLAEQDAPDTTSIALAQLAALSGCFTTLVKIADHLQDMQTGTVLGRLKLTKEMLQ